MEDNKLIGTLTSINTIHGEITEIQSISGNIEKVLKEEVPEPYYEISNDSGTTIYIGG